MVKDAPPQGERDGAAFTTIVGIDCATQASKIGLARARRRNGSWVLTDAHCASVTAPPADTVARWIAVDPSSLLALDAPLGWPEAMGRALPSHEAGGRVEAPADRMFDRATDRYVRRVTGKNPLSVGADRIARTAHATLEMLATIRELSGMPVPLAWSPAPSTTPAAIEVYPGATLVAHGTDLATYGPKAGEPAQAAIRAFIERQLDVATGLHLANARHDTLDAVLCIVAGLDFLEGTAAPPEDAELARREGWIWMGGGRRT